MGFKRLSKLEFKSLNPVAVLINLLPQTWEAKVVKAVDAENGVIQISCRKAGADMSGDLKLGVTKIFAIFHVDDVFTNVGTRFRQTPNDSVLHLRGSCVDLTARSIVSDASCSMAGVFHTAASQILLSQMYE